MHLPKPCYPFLFDDRMYPKVYSRENIVMDIHELHSSIVLSFQQLSKQTQNAYYMPSTELTNREHRYHHRLKVEEKGPLLPGRKQTAHPHLILCNAISDMAEIQCLHSASVPEE